MEESFTRKSNLPFKHFGFNNINISVNYMAKKITDYFGNGENYGVNIKYKETNKLGTADHYIFKKQNFIANPCAKW